MRNMSFMHTTDQVRGRSKTVTRRNGWLFLKVGDLLCAVEKGQGLGKGGKVKRICTIRVKDVRREPLRQICDDPTYGDDEMVREGFPPPHPKSAPGAFLKFFCNSHRGVQPDSIITRIEFDYPGEAT